MEKLHKIRYHPTKFLYKPENSESAFLISKPSAKPICNHKIDYKTFKKYIKNKHPNQNPCPICLMNSDSSPKKIQELNFFFEKAGIQFKIGKNGAELMKIAPDIKRGKMEKDEDSPPITPTQQKPASQKTTQEAESWDVLRLETGELLVLSEDLGESEYAQRSPQFRKRETQEIDPQQSSADILGLNPSEIPIIEFWKKSEDFFEKNEMYVAEEYFKEIVSNPPNSRREFEKKRNMIYGMESQFKYVMKLRSVKATLHFFNYLVLCLFFTKTGYSKFKNDMKFRFESFRVFIFDDIVEINYGWFAFYMGFLGTSYLSDYTNEIDHIISWISRMKEVIGRDKYLSKWEMKTYLSTKMIQCTIKGQYIEKLIDRIAMDNWDEKGIYKPPVEGEQYSADVDFPEALEVYFNTNEKIGLHNTLFGAIVSQNEFLVSHLVKTSNLYSHRTNNKGSDNLMTVVIEMAYLQGDVFTRIAEILAKELNSVYPFEEWAKKPMTEFNPITRASEAIKNAINTKDRESEVLYFHLFSLFIKYSNKEIIADVTKILLKNQ